MKYIIYILLFLGFGFGVKAQTQWPSGFPTQKSIGWQEWGYQMSDSATIIATRDTAWRPRFAGTIVLWPHLSVDTTFWYWNGLNWGKVKGATIDTTSLSNRINLKLNIIDTTSKWLGIGSRLVDTVYRVNDSTVGYTIKGNARTFQILGRLPSGGTGTLTSVALSMPAAFTVSGSPVTGSSGTFNVSGAGTSLQYIRGDGTLATMDTTAIPNFFIKARSLLSGTSPITYSSTTGAIGINNANTSGTKGAATFTNSDFSDNGVGTISLANVVASGSCINCQFNVDAKGRITSYASGTVPIVVNAPGAGDTLIITGDTIKRLNAGYGILHSVTQYSITESVDTTLIQNLITANNGLTKIGNTIQLGGSLIQPTAITSAAGANRITYSGVSSFGDGAQFDVATTGNAGIAVRGTTNDGRGVMGVATTGVGVYGTATGSGGYGLFGISTLGNAIYGRADSGIIWEGAMVPQSTNTIVTARSTTRSAQSSASNGIGYSDDSYLHSSTVDVFSHRWIYKLTNATNANYTSGLEFWQANNATVARKFLLSGTGQWTWDGYPSLTKQTDSTTYKPLGYDGSGNIVPMANWIGSGNKINTGNLDTVLSLGGRLSTTRSVSMGQNIWYLDSSDIHLKNVDSASLVFELNKAADIIKFYKPAGVARTYPGSNPFKWIMENATDDVPTQRNNPVKWGWNINRADSSSYPGIWYSMEPNYRPGGATFLENHLEVSLPNGLTKNSRLFSSTFQVKDSIGNSVNTWDFRGNTFNFSNLLNTVTYMSAGVGTLNVNNTTASNTEISISNGTDVSRFDLNPGTGILEYSGPVFQIDGDLNAINQTNNSNGRAGVRYIVPGGSTAYIIHYAPSWASQSYLQDAMVMTAAGGNPLGASLTLKTDGTTWLGDITTFNTGTQNVNISGSMAMRGNPIATTATYLLGKRADSTVVELTPSSLSSLITTLYTGDGSIPGNRTLTGNNHILTLDTLNYFRVNAFSQVFSWPDKTSPYTASIITTSKNYQIGYTPTPLVYSKGAGLYIDTNNNAGLGTVPNVASPLYATGTSGSVNGFQSLGSNFLHVDSIATNVTLNLTEYFIRGNASGGAITFTLPSASTAFGASIGIVYKIQKIDASGNAITINRSGADTINGATSQTISTQYDVHEVQCTSTTTWAYK